MEISWNFVSPEKWEPCKTQLSLQRGFSIQMKMLDVATAALLFTRSFKL